MKTSELKKLLEARGCWKVKEGGDHEKWFSPITNKIFSVWRHPSKDIPAGTLNRILKDSGLKK